MNWEAWPGKVVECSIWSLWQTAESAQLEPLVIGRSTFISPLLFHSSELLICQKKIFLVLFTSSDKHRQQMSEVQHSDTPRYIPNQDVHCRHQWGRGFCQHKSSESGMGCWCCLLLLKSVLVKIVIKKQEIRDQICFCRSWKIKIIMTNWIQSFLLPPCLVLPLSMGESSVAIRKHRKDHGW